MRGDFFMTEVFYSTCERIAVVGANFSQPSNGGAIFSQTVIVNKSPGGKFIMLGVHEKIAPLC